MLDANITIPVKGIHHMNVVRLKTLPGMSAWPPPAAAPPPPPMGSLNKIMSGEGRRAR
jgi:hypothetical protein